MEYGFGVGIMDKINDYQQCIKSMAGESLIQNAVHLINFDGGRQVNV